MLFATDDLKTLTSPAGSAIVFSIQLSPVVDQFEDLTDRAFVFAVFDSATEEEKAYWDGVVDTAARTITWTIHGNETRALYKLPTLKFQIVERRGGASFDPIAEGALTITQSAPRIASLDNASISRYIVRIVRFAPPNSILAPRFTQTTELWNAPAIVAPTLSALGLSSTAFDQNAAVTLNITGATSGSVITASGLPSGLSISGRTLVGTVVTPSSFPITLTETLTGAIGSPRATSVTLTVRTVLAALALSSTAFQAGVASNVNITGAATGSTLSATNLPAGLTLNSSARTITGTPTTSGSASVTITETLAGATGSPKSGTFTLSVAAATFTLFALTLSNATGQAGSAFTSNIVGTTAGSTLSASGLPSGVTLNSSARALTGTPGASGTFTVTIIETLGSASNSPRSSTVTLTIALTAPSAVGSLDHRYYSINTGDQTFNIASGFSGSNLTYSVVSAPSGALYTINATTGQIVVQTTSATSGDVVVKATNSLGSATQSFPLFVTVAATYTVLARKSNGTVTVESLAPTIKLALKRETNGTITISETV